MLHRTCDGVTRRDFLKAGAIGSMPILGGGLSLGGFLQMTQAGSVSAGAKAKKAIFINLSGGPSHMDTFDLKPDAPDTHRGEFNPISTSVPGLQICEHLPKMAQVMDKCTLLRGVSHSLAAHRLGSEYVNTGNRPLPSLEFPGYAAVVAKEIGAPPELPPAVSIPNAGQRAGYLGVQYAPLQTGSTPQAGRPFSVRGISLGGGLTVGDVERRTRLLDRLDVAFGEFEKQDQLLTGLDKFSEQAYAMITSSQAREAFDVSKEPKEVSERFGDSNFGQSCLLASRLVGSGVPFVTVQMGGWDTHRNGWETLKNRNLPDLDAGLSGMLTTLDERGLLDETVVYVTGEFGRTPKINTERIGRDHYPRNMFMLMAGGGVARGRVVGESDAKGEMPKDTPITPDQVAATFYHCLGIDHTKEYQTTTGRPVMIVRDGNVLSDVLA